MTIDVPAGVIHLARDEASPSDHAGRQAGGRARLHYTKGEEET